MEHKNLGRSGLQVPVVGLGCNNFGRRCDQEQAAAVVHKALELGVAFFDTADIYGPQGLSEEYLGATLQGQRREAIIATKFVGPMGEGPLWGGASRRYIFESVEASLRRLGTDYIDLHQIHFPDARTPIEETLRALDDLVRQARPKRLRFAIFTQFGRVVRHARRQFVRLTSRALEVVLRPGRLRLAALAWPPL